MAMRSQSDGRRVYTRGGTVVVCYGGAYFGPPANKETAINPEKEVSIEVLDKAGGKARIKVTQKSGGKKISETWNEKKLTFEKRAST